MRVNWCLKYSNDSDLKVELKPVAVESYLEHCGIDLNYQMILNAFIAVCLTSDLEGVKGITEALCQGLERKTAKYADSFATNNLRLWNGVSVTINLANPKDFKPHMPINDRHLQVTYLHYSAAKNETYRAELNFTLNRYASICPQEFYYYTKDHPELDPK